MKTREFSNALRDLVADYVTDGTYEIDWSIPIDKNGQRMGWMTFQYQPDRKGGVL